MLLQAEAGVLLAKMLRTSTFSPVVVQGVQTAPASIDVYAIQVCFRTPSLAKLFSGPQAVTVISMEPVTDCF